MTDKERKVFILFLTVSPALPQSVPPVPSPASSCARQQCCYCCCCCSAIRRGDNAALVRVSAIWVVLFVLSLQKPTWTQAMDKLDDQREIQGSWRDPGAGSRSEPGLFWRNPHSGKTEGQTHRPCCHLHGSCVETQCCCNELPFCQLLLPGCYSWVCGD